MKKHDVIIIGMGLSALTTAARLYEGGIRNIGVYGASFGGTPYIAAINFVLPENPYGDTVEQYCADMLNAGYGIGNKALVQEMTGRTLEGYHFLQRWGIEFARNPDGATKLRHLSGHTYPRSLCSTTALIGDVMLRKLCAQLEEKGIAIHQGYECLQLLTRDNKICGATFKTLDGSIENIYSGAVVAAWGGVGNLFAVSTYPEDIQGNILAIAKDAGAKLVDIEFLEYEPMVVLDPRGAVGEPCPTAMLGEGAHLLNAQEERFLLAVRPQGEGGAPKTLLNKEIWKQVAAGHGSPHGGVWADLRHIPREVLKAYPWFFERLMSNGVDPNKQLIEVGPMAHSFSGGICVDGQYQSTVSGLYAVGEASGGTHGACRCAGNAASQAVLSGLICAQAILANPRAEIDCEMPIEYRQNQEVYHCFAPRAKQIAKAALGVYRDAKTLENAASALEEMLADSKINDDTRTAQTLKSILLMINAAQNRKESRGTHLRLDYPETSEAFARAFIW